VLKKESKQELQNAIVVVREGGSWIEGTRLPGRRSVPVSAPFPLIVRLYQKNALGIFFRSPNAQRHVYQEHPSVSKELSS
jgi:hypothetical protein